MEIYDYFDIIIYRCTYSFNDSARKVFECHTWTQLHRHIFERRCQNLSIYLIKFHFKLKKSIHHNEMTVPEMNNGICRQYLFVTVLKSTCSKLHLVVSDGVASQWSDMNIIGQIFYTLEPASWCKYWRVTEKKPRLLVNVVAWHFILLFFGTLNFVLHL